MNLQIQTNANAVGSVGGLFENLTINGNPALNGVAVGGTFNVTVNTPFGTGSAFGLNPVVLVAKNASFANSISGEEVDVGISLGNYAREKLGLTIVSLPRDKMHGSVVDAAFAIGAAMGGAGFNTGITFGNAGSGEWPITQTGTLITAAVAIWPYSTDGGLRHRFFRRLSQDRIPEIKRLSGGRKRQPNGGWL